MGLDGERARESFVAMVVVVVFSYIHGIDIE
jgi:hypothetical protein